MKGDRILNENFKLIFVKFEFQISTQVKNHVRPENLKPT